MTGGWLWLLGVGLAGGIGWLVIRDMQRQAAEARADLCDRYRDVWKISNEAIRREGTQA